MKFINFTVLFFLVGCVSLVKVPKEFKYVEINTGKFTLASWQKVKRKNSSYRIYIEGDGNAFDAYRNPTKDPTPKKDLMRKFAFSDNGDNVIYLARPCQFVKGAECKQEYWTTARFSEEVIKSTADAIKYIVGNNDTVLIGYSGGAQVAGLVAVGNYGVKVKKLITIAGNLDHPSWTSYHKVRPLTESMDLNNYRDKYAKIPQIHYVGERDRIVPPFLTENFVENKKLIIKVPKVGHGGFSTQLKIEK
jgi:pimeloyl-ACP methyl ester carboxylesterase